MNESYALLAMIDCQLHWHCRLIDLFFLIEKKKKILKPECMDKEKIEKEIWGFEIFPHFQAALYINI